MAGKEVMSFSTTMPIERPEKVEPDDDDLEYTVSEAPARPAAPRRPRAKLADEDLEYCGYELCSKVARVRCSKCKVVAYCSARCQRLAWVKGHREACGRAPPKLLPPDPDPDDGAAELESGAFDLSPRRTSRHFLKFHDNDKLAGLPKLFLSDPTAFEPCREPGEPSDFLRWGLPSRELEVTQDWMMRKLQTNFSLYADGDTPEIQFVKKLAARKEKALAAGLRDARTRFDAVYTIRVAVRVVPTPWRRLRVRGGCTLEELHEILGAALGWSRRRHGYYFTDPTDGALFGPGDSSGFDDFKHVDAHGFYHLDASRTRLCELVKTTGQRLRYLYDLDCAWDHELVLDELFCVSGEKPEDASYDVPDVLGGEHACPPEDGAGIPDDPMAEHTPGRRKDGGKGTADYAAFLRSYHPGGAPGGRNREKMLEILEDMRDAVNWDDDAVREPTAFKLARARDRLFRRLGKTPKVPNPGDDEPKDPAKEAKDPKKRNPLDDERFYEQRVCPEPAKLDAASVEEGDAIAGPPPPPPEVCPEPEPIDPDAPRCLNCGAYRRADGSRLKRCSGCQEAHFCGSFCQKAAWIHGHRYECAAGKPRPPKVWTQDDYIAHFGDTCRRPATRAVVGLALATYVYFRFFY